MLGASAITAIGLLKLNMTGPGITQTVKGLWHRPPKGSAAPAKSK
jgi:succinate dehydrogenase (ubiquinone) membrane anchor subunit